MSKPKRTWVNVYTVTRHYGGPEEGGWWYDNHTCEASYGPFYSEEMAEAAHDYAVTEHGPLTSGRRYSVLNNYDTVIYYEDHPGQSRSGWSRWE